MEPPICARSPGDALCVVAEKLREFDDKAPERGDAHWSTQPGDDPLGDAVSNRDIAPDVEPEPDV
ncbi:MULTISPECIES: hypothetical protein [Sphingobium]|uniref:Uncharacterized protein n=1 Tax=Sphingobium fuliginis (strain ATCC 27551) TaxID=336203 RepID=A0A292ZCN9_SPHSA|nr:MULTISPECIES: hypothetical protein [Sphingobium]AJR27016.1 hypothetical protein TZ53_24965 [Sphingobium sp. YBL2]QPI75572.1 hypothetical protein IZV00_19175 [Sphingobium sp. Cam5-1]GAY20651.1 hypothetical protein SFOMI_1181 [Sphingobium fuliginis]